MSYSDLNVSFGKGSLYYRCALHRLINSALSDIYLTLNDCIFIYSTTIEKKIVADNIPAPSAWFGFGFSYIILK